MWGDMTTIGAPIPHPSKPNDWQILAQVVKAHKAVGPLTLETFGYNRCPICKEFLCKGKINKSYCALFEE